MRPLRRLPALILLALSPIAWADLMIDDFSASQYFSVSGAPSGYKSAFNSVADLAILGGERDAFLERTSTNSGSISMDVNGSFTDAMAYASSPATSGRAIITYDGTDGSSAFNPTGLGGVDLTLGGQYHGLNIHTTSDIGASVTFTIYTDATRYSTYTLPVLADPTFTFVDYFVNWTSFTTGAGAASGADFTNVGAITLTMDGTTNPGTDIGIDYFAASVPEPSGAVLLGTVGLLWLGRRRRR